MDQTDFINSYGAFKLRWVKGLVFLNFEGYSREIKDKIYYKVLDYYLDRYTFYDPKHKFFAPLIFAYEDTIKYINILKQEEEKVKNLVNKIINDDY